MSAQALTMESPKPQDATERTDSLSGSSQDTQPGQSAPSWMLPAGIATIAIGVLGCWASAVGEQGARADMFASAVLVSMMTTPLVFVGIPLGCYWLYRSAKGSGHSTKQEPGAKMAPAFELPDGRRLFIHPEPSEPSPTMKPGWSAAARRRWLEGEPAPDPAEVFKTMAETFSRFIDLPEAHASGVTATAVCWAMLSYIY